MSLEDKDYILPSEGVKFSTLAAGAGLLGFLALTRGKVGLPRAIRSIAAEAPNKLLFNKFMGVPTAKSYGFYTGGRVPSMVEAAQRGIRGALKRKSLFDKQYKVDRVSQSSAKSARKFIDEGKLIIGDKTLGIEEKKRLLKQLFNEADSRLLEDAAHFVERTGKTNIPANSKLAKYTRDKITFEDDALKQLTNEPGVGPELAEQILAKQIGGRNINPNKVVAMNIGGRRLYGNLTQAAHMSGKEKSLLLQWLSWRKGKISSVKDLSVDVLSYFKRLGYKGEDLLGKSRDAMKSLGLTDGQLTFSFSPGGKPHYFSGGFYATGRLGKVSKQGELLPIADTVPKISWTPTDFHDLGGSTLDKVTSSFMKKRVMAIYKTSSRKSIERSKFKKYFDTEAKKLINERSKIKKPVTKGTEKTSIKRAEKDILKLNEVSDRDLATLSGASQEDVKILRDISKLYQMSDIEMGTLLKTLGIAGTAGIGAAGGVALLNQD